MNFENFDDVKRMLKKQIKKMEKESNGLNRKGWTLSQLLVTSRQAYKFLYSQYFNKQVQEKIQLMKAFGYPEYATDAYEGMNTLYDLFDQLNIKIKTNKKFKYKLPGDKRSKVWSNKSLKS